MRFCPDCGKLLMPRNKKIKCDCGYEEELSDEVIEQEYRFDGERKKEMEV